MCFHYLFICNFLGSCRDLERRLPLTKEKATLGIVFVFFRGTLTRSQLNVMNWTYAFPPPPPSPGRFSHRQGIGRRRRRWPIGRTRASPSARGNGDERRRDDGESPSCALLRWWVQNTRADGGGREMCTSEWQPAGSLCAEQTTGSPLLPPRPPFLLPQTARKPGN